MRRRRVFHETPETKLKKEFLKVLNLTIFKINSRSSVHSHTTGRPPQKQKSASEIIVSAQIVRVIMTNTSVEQTPASESSSVSSFLPSTNWTVNRSVVVQKHIFNYS